jgi:hypothetical protein
LEGRPSVIALPIDRSLDVVNKNVISKEFVLPVCLSASFIDRVTADTSPPIAGDDMDLLFMSLLVCTMIP